MAAKKILSLLLFWFTFHASGQDTSRYANGISVGAELSDQYLQLFTGKRIAVVGNQTSMVGGEHLVDFLLGLGIDIKKVFAPEHGFRGKADAGERINDGLDAKTGLPIKSLHGRRKKPSKEDLFDVDMVVFDIQDVGCSFLYVHLYDALRYGSVCRTKQTFRRAGSTESKWLLCRWPNLENGQ